MTPEQEEVVEQWIAALESGKYKQTKEKLRRCSKGEDRFCCLGVLCEILGAERCGRNGYRFGSDESDYYLPDGIRNAAGLNYSSGSFDKWEDGRGHSLADLNDNGVSFLEIAKIIRSRPVGLFKDPASHEQP